MTAVSGVRNSCDMLARKILFMRLAACARRYCSSSWMFWRRKASSAADFLAAQFAFFERALDGRSQPQNAILQQIVGGAFLHALNHLVFAEGSGEHDKGDH